VYVPANDECAFAEAVDTLLNDAGGRHRMGEIGRSRVEEELSWEMSRRALVGFYSRLLGVDTSWTAAQTSC
jgi:glycosyltransferase involved in cell wall biosynthesis